MARSLNSLNNPIGDNSGAISSEELRNYVGRGLNLRKMQKDLADDIKELCAEADERGVCSKKELRRLMRIAGMEQEVFEAQREREDMLVHALGDFAELPLGEAAIKRAAPAPAKRGHKPKAQTAIEAAQAHLDAGGELEDAGEGWTRI